MIDVPDASSRVIESAETADTVPESEIPPNPSPRPGNPWPLAGSWPLPGNWPLPVRPRGGGGRRREASSRRTRARRRRSRRRARSRSDVPRPPDESGFAITLARGSTLRAVGAPAAASETGASRCVGLTDGSGGVAGGSARGRSSRVSLLVAKGGDGIEAGGLAGGPDPEDDADDQAEADCDDDGERAEGESPARDRGDDGGGRDAEDDADQAAQPATGRGPRPGTGGGCRSRGRRSPCGSRSRASAPGR